MRYSRLFGKTVREAPKEAKLLSHKLLYQGGFIRESAAGRYYFLPLGWRVHEKLRKIIKEEMDKAGAQEMLSPVLHPLELWEETNRTASASFELMRVKDRNGASFALGGTAEEMFVDLVRKTKLSYRDLPFNIYQFSTKFRDEMRPRGGLLRVKEFVMKDAYSFDCDEEHFRKTYKLMWATYKKIFDRLGLTTVVIESDNGYIGGEYCHEFVVPSEIGESKYLTTEDGSYKAHEEVAKFTKYKETIHEVPKDRQDVEGKGLIGVATLAKFLNIPTEKTTKTILFETDKGEVVAAAVNGIYDVNEVKLKNILHCAFLRLASPEIVKKVTGAEIGYAGILNLPESVRVVMDESLRGRTNFECGANKTNFHSININFGRDLPEPENYYDICLAKDGYLSIDGKKKLIEERGIEVGNIFQLGYHYTHLMKGANFIDSDGKEKPYYMGCYGIGLGRTMAAMVEVFHDEKGICWLKVVTPYDVHLISLNSNERADKVYEELTKAGIEVLYDDREDVSAGVKFSDYDLIGIPIRLIVSDKTKEQIEFKQRSTDKISLLSIEEVIKILKPGS